MSDLAASPEPGPAALLDRRERRALGWRITLALICAGLLAIAGITWIASPGQRDLAALIAALATVLVAAPTLRAAWAGLLRPGLHGVTEQLVALVVLAAWATGDIESAALVPLAMVVGHILEERSVVGTRTAIAALARLARVGARRLSADGAVSVIPAERLALGDVIELRPGDRAPADARVREGSGGVDASAITGESTPVDVAPGGLVPAGAIATDARLVCEVVRIGGDTTLGRVVALLREAERAKPPIARFLERYAGCYLAVVVLIAAATWFVSGDVRATLAVIVAACPCALVVAAPAAAVAGVASAARHGILVAGSAFLERLGEVDTLIVDKTGTVTRGSLHLLRVAAAEGVDPTEAQAVAAGIAAASSHPVSRAIAGSLPRDRHLAVNDARERGGLGVTATATASGAPVALGRAALIAELSIAIPPLPAHDGPVVGVARDGRFLAWLLLADEIRPEAAEALAELRGLGLHRQILLTGDRREVAAAVAQRLGIVDVESGILPERKLARVTAEIAAGRRPLVVGDGVNDALALRAGSVGMAMGLGGTDVALAASDVVLTTSDLRGIGAAIRLSRKSRRTVSLCVAVGLAWTAGVMALAAAGLIAPLAAALLHNVGTVAVLLIAGSLLRFEEHRPRG